MTGRMRRRWCGAGAAGLAIGAVLALVVWQQTRFDPVRLLAAYHAQPPDAGIEIVYPLVETLFPPESVPPVFRWTDPSEAACRWLIAFEFADGLAPLFFPTETATWAAPEDAWETIKQRSRGAAAQALILGLTAGGRSRLVSAAALPFSTSADEVGAPLFYREVNLPFADAIKDPSRIRWRFGPISSREPPPVVLEKLPVCGNCHSFSADGKVLGMDVDYGSDKGAYAILPVAPQMTLTRDRIITWNDFKRETKLPSQGLMSQVSPDGRYVISTVRDQAVFLPVNNLAFSQLFFPIKGILGVYDREANTLEPLPGADDPAFVQSNAVWSPDGQWILFARGQAHALRRRPGEQVAPLTMGDCEELIRREKTFQFDLYRIPFNGGKGGTPEPIPGASHNGLSNYFPKFSPDGRWIIFCQAKSFMLLQPDSALYILPAAGGQPRRLRCNTERMNSWHSWSPNGKWLVFASKAFTPYTQLFLTHIDERGESTPPVLLEQFTSADRAANIPEFVNVPPDGIVHIQERFLDDYSYANVAEANVKAGDIATAEQASRQALAINPKNPRALGYLGSVLTAKRAYDEADRCFRESLQVEPDSPFVHLNYGHLLLLRGQQELGLAEMRAAVQLEPDLYDARYRLGMGLLRARQFAESEQHLREAVRIWASNVNAQCGLAQTFQAQGQDATALVHFQAALKQDPNYAPALLGLARLYAESSLADVRNPAAALELAERAGQRHPSQRAQALLVIATAHADAGRYPEAVASATAALAIATSQKQEELAGEIRQRLDRYRAKAKTS